MLLRYSWQLLRMANRKPERKRWQNGKKIRLLINALCFMYFAFADKIQTLVVLLIYIKTIGALRRHRRQFDSTMLFVLTENRVRFNRENIELKLKLPFIIYFYINIE